MTIVYVLHVTKPLEGSRGKVRHSQRFTFKSRDEAWSAYTKAIQSGLEATVEEVIRTRVRERDEVTA